ncbi:MAG TPA: DNA polymerase III subunit delta [Ktedonobacterales bacterium]
MGAMFYLFHGPDEFTMREELARLRSGGGFELSQDVYPGGEVSLATITATCDTLPFLSARRFVVVDGLPKRRRASKEQETAPGDQSGDRGAGATAPGSAADGRSRKGGARLKGGAGSGADPKAFTQGLAEYVRRLPETSVLVVLADEELEASHPLLLAAQRFGQARAFQAPKGAQLETWLARRAAALHAQLAPDAARLLASYVGADLRQLASELEKLATYVGDDNVISAEVVRLLTPTTQQARIFDLTDALARRDRPRALALLHELLEAGESALGIVALMAHQTRSLIQVKALAERGLRPVQIAQTAGMAPFLVDKSLALARQFTAAQLAAAHHALLEADTALKLSKLTPEMALDLFVVEFGL